MVKIPDISEWQGTVDFKKLLPTIDAIIIRIQAGSNHLDSYAEKNIKAVSKTDTPYMIYAYHYGVNESDSAKEATDAYNRTIKFVKSAGGKMPKAFILDDEEDTATNQLKACQAWINQMKKLTSSPVGFYTYSSRYASKGYKAIKADFDWIANYSSEPTISYDLWQYSDKVKFDGITNPCDASKNMSKNMTTILKMPSKLGSKPVTNKIPTGFTKENGTFTVTTKGGIAVHTAPTTGSTVTGYLMPNNSVKYDSWQHTNGYYWIHYIGQGGVDLYLPSHPSNTNNHYWGTFK